MPPLTCIWNPGSLRATQFTEAMLRLHGCAPTVLPWMDALDSFAIPASPGVVRIDSPGRDWSMEKELIGVGALLRDEHDPHHTSWTHLDHAEVAVLSEDKGRVFASRQWYLGLRDALDWLQFHCWEEGGDETRWMQHPEDIKVIFDKAACHERCHDAGCRVPPALGVALGFDDLMERMEHTGMHRVFLKLCHGSSASGAVALEMSGGRIQAFSTARIERPPHGVRLYNDRKVQRYTSREAVRELVDAVCRERAWAEAWVPKAGWQDRRFDVRVLVIGGHARHVVARLADGPFTNLQLGGHRAYADELRQHIGDAAFTAMCGEAERAMSAFPRSLHGGVDILLEPVHHRPTVLEVNAFGDLLPGCLHEGKDTYTWELEALEK